MRPLCWFIACALLGVSVEAADLPRLRVAPDGHHLAMADGKPFFWLGDTAWYMIGKATREDAEDQPSVLRYLDNRAAKGFNVIQTVAVNHTRLGGIMANAYGQLPFADGDFTRPRLAPGADDDYWDFVDWIVDAAAQRGLYLALLPLWLNEIEDDHPMLRDPSVAYRYGHFLGTRYRTKTNIIWIMGGDAWKKDHNVNTPARMALVRALAEGIADGSTGQDRFDGQADWSAVLLSFHPPGGGHSSSDWLQQEPWLAFNMIQTTTQFHFANYDTVSRDYALVPTKPTLDSEVAYEDSLSLNKGESQDRRVRPWDVRRAAWWAVCSGACGHTYGHRSYIGWIRQDETWRYGAHIPWWQVLDAPGSFQVGHLRRFMESHHFPSLVPAAAMVLHNPADDNHVAVLRSQDGRQAILYSPRGENFTVDLSGLNAQSVRAFWFSPRNGLWRHGEEESAQPVPFAQHIPCGPGAKPQLFDPPGDPGDENDWVLLLEVEAAN